MKLYNFPHSSASWRVRIALALKGLDAVLVPVSLIDDDHKSADYADLNPNQRVPTLITDEGDVLTQSMAILAWLDEVAPTPALLPSDALSRARCRAFANTIAEDIFPVQNLGVRRKLGRDYRATADQQASWCADWIIRGFAALELETARRGWTPADGFLFGAAPSLAEICLVPQVNNALRYRVDMAAFPLLMAARDRAMTLDAFSATAPPPLN